MGPLIPGLLTAAAASLLPLAAGFAGRWDTRRRQVVELSLYVAFANSVMRHAIQRGQAEQVVLEAELATAKAANQHLKGGEQ